jgi:hypothetical protein
MFYIIRDQQHKYFSDLISVKNHTQDITCTDYFQVVTKFRELRRYFGSGDSISIESSVLPQNTEGAGCPSVAYHIE